MLNIFKKMRGDELLRLEKDGSDFDLSYVFREIRRHGVTDKDIRLWWNMPDEQLSEIIQEDDESRNQAYKHWVNSGLSKDDAKLKLRKTFPIYELYQPGYIHDLIDSNLPYELSPRVSRFFNSVDKMLEYKTEIDNASSMNAFIRDLIKRKVI